MLATEDTNKILPNELWLAMDHLGINGCDMLSPPLHNTKGEIPLMLGIWESRNLIELQLIDEHYLHNLS
jgi:hypothetical protein